MEDRLTDTFFYTNEREARKSGIKDPEVWNFLNAYFLVVFRSIVLVDLMREEEESWRSTMLSNVVKNPIFSRLEMHLWLIHEVFIAFAVISNLMET